MRARAGRLILAGASTVVVTAAVIGGVLVLEAPSQERLRRLDSRRVADLGQTVAAVDLYWTRHGRLPASLEELAGEPGIAAGQRDPRTGESYEYRAVRDTTYEICAHFEGASKEEYQGSGPGFWTHDPGRQCFELAPRRLVGR